MMKLDTERSNCNWYIDEEGQFHPVFIGTVRCHKRIDDPDGQSFEVVENDVFTVPGRYCRNMYKCTSHETEGAKWNRVFVGTWKEDIIDEHSVV